MASKRKGGSRKKNANKKEYNNISNDGEIVE